MRWLKQVAHVAAKDALMTRWLLAAYAILMALAVLRLIGWVAGLWSLLALLTALIAIAQVVQADSPIRDDAFWVSRPLSPRAVFAAKALALLALLLIASAGYLLLLMRYAVAGPALARSLGKAALISAALFAAALVAAALTRELRSFAMAMIGGGVAWIVASVSLEDRVGPLFSTGTWVPALVVVLGSLGIALYQYATGRRLYALGQMLVLLCASAVLAAAGESDGKAGPVPLLPSGSRPVVHVSRSGNPANLQLAVRTAGVSGQAYVLTHAMVQLRRRDGSQFGAALERSSLSPQALPEVPGAHWAGTLEREATRGVLLSLSRRVAARAPDATAEQLEGQINAWRGSVAAQLPLRAGASAATSGRRLRVLAAEASPDGPEVELEVSQVTGNLGPSVAFPLGFMFDLPDRVRYAVLDRRSGTAYPLVERGSSGGGTFLLPEIVTMKVHLEPWTRATLQPLAAAPPAGDLALLVFDWRLVGRFPVSSPIVAAAAAVPGPSASAGPATARSLTAGER